MENPFPPNSHKSQEQKESRPEKKAIQKVTTGEVVHKKATIGKRFKDIFFGGELKKTSMFIASDVLLPALKNLIVDATSKGIERAVYGDSPRRRVDQNRPRFSYNNPIDRGPRRSVMLPDQPPHYARRKQPVGEFILSSRSEAELVVERLSDIIDKYEVASVADLYELVGLPSSYVDNTWGWTSLSYVNVRQTRDGFVIDLPPAEAL